MNAAAVVFVFGTIVLTGTTVFAAGVGDMAIAMVCAAITVVCPVAAMVSYASTASPEAMHVFALAIVLSVLFFLTSMVGYVLQGSHVPDDTTADEAPAVKPVMVNVTALAPVSHRRSRRRPNRRLHLPVIHFTGRRSEHAHA